MKKLILFFVLFSACSTTTTNLKSLEVFGNKKTSVQSNNFFDAVYVETNIYPPANGKCVEILQLNKLNKQCNKWVSWQTYIKSINKNYTIIKLNYDYKNKTMLIYVRGK